MKVTSIWHIHVDSNQNKQELGAIFSYPVLTFQLPVFQVFFVADTDFLS